MYEHMTKEEKQKLIDEYYEERDWLDSWDVGMTSLEWNARNRMLQEYYERTIKPLLRNKK